MDRPLAAVFLGAVLCLSVMAYGQTCTGGETFDSFLQRPVETSMADPRQLTHPLDTQAALHRHHFSDLVIDAVSPALLLFWRRSSTFCKAPLKKSASSDFPPQHALQVAYLFTKLPHRRSDSRFSPLPASDSASDTARCDQRPTPLPVPIRWRSSAFAPPPSRETLSDTCSLASYSLPASLS